MAGQNKSYVVFHLNRWERTTIGLTLRERILCLFTGKVKLGGMGDGIGWVPVFDNEQLAANYRDEAAPNATILPTDTRIEE